MFYKKLVFLLVIVSLLVGISFATDNDTFNSDNQISENNIKYEENNQVNDNQIVDTSNHGSSITSKNSSSSSSSHLNTSSSSASSNESDYVTSKNNISSSNQINNNHSSNSSTGESYAYNNHNNDSDNVKIDDDYNISNTNKQELDSEDMDNDLIFEQSDFDIDSVLKDRVDVKVSTDDSNISTMDSLSVFDSATNLYVNGKTGDDSNTGDKNNPFATILKAIESTGVSNSFIIHISDGTYELPNKSLDNRKISFVGNGIDNTILNVRDHTGLVIGTSTISFENLTITNATHSGKGGVLKINSNVNLTINNCKFTNNYAGIGSVLFTSGDYNNVTIKNCIFTNNSAVNQSGVLHITGQNSIYTIENCYFNNNSCETNNSFKRIAGVIYSGSQANTTINACNFTNNTAFNGTCIYNGDGSTLKVINCNFTNNFAVHGTTTENKTRGALVIGSGTVEMGNCYFANNTADYGAAISVNSGEEVIIDSSIFYQNKAYTLAGAIYNFGDLTITNSQFIQNNGTRRGGAIVDIGKRNITLKNTTFYENCVVTNALNETSMVPQGGAISINGQSLDFTIDNCTFNHNSGYYGGAIYSEEDNKFITITNTLFHNNTAKYGGALCVATSNQIYIYDSVFNVNRAVRDGGAIVVNGTGAIYIYNTNFTNNSVERSDGEGGALYILQNSKITIENGLFNNNSVLSNGGAISIHNSLTLNIFSTKFTSNKASCGGAIYIDKGNSKNDSTVYLESCTVTSNTGNYQLFSLQDYDSQSNNNIVNKSNVDSSSIYNFKSIDSKSSNNIEILNNNKVIKSEEETEYIFGTDLYNVLETGVNYTFHFTIIDKNDFNEYENYGFKWKNCTEYLNDIFNTNSKAVINISLDGDPVEDFRSTLMYSQEIKKNVLYTFSFYIEDLIYQEFRNLDLDSVEYHVTFHIYNESQGSAFYFPVGMLIDSFTKGWLKTEFSSTAYSGDNLTAQLFPPDISYPWGYEMFASYLATFTENYGGYFQLFVNGKLNTTYDTTKLDLNNLNFSYKIPVDYSGQLDLFLVYVTQDNFTTNIIYSQTVNVTKSENIPVIISAKNITQNVNNSITFSATIQENNGTFVNMGTVVIKLNGVTQAKVNVINGTISYTTDTYYGAGQYNLTYAYVSNEKYTRSEAQYILTINKYQTKLTGSDLSGCVNETIQITGILTDSNNNPINGTVVIKINGNTFARVSVKNGIYAYNYTIPNYSTKDYIISYVYPGDNRYDRLELNKTLTITKQKVVIETSTISAVAGKTVNLTGTVKTYNGTKVTSGMVNIKINGKTIARLDLTSDTFSYEYTLPADYTAKDYNITYVYGQNNQYDRAENSTTLTIENQTSNIQITNITVQNRTMKITAQITGKETNISALAGNAGFKINGVTAKDSNGNPIKVNVRDKTVTFTYELPDNIKSGNYNITVTYSGGRNLEEGRTSADVILVL